MRVSAAEPCVEVLRGAQLPQVFFWQPRKSSVGLCVCSECYIQPSWGCCTGAHTSPGPNSTAASCWQPAAVPFVSEPCSVRGHRRPGAPFPALPPAVGDSQDTACPRVAAAALRADRVPCAARINGAARTPQKSRNWKN